MKRIKQILTMLAAAVLLPMNVWAEDVPIDKDHFPEGRFRDLIFKYDANNDRILQESEAQTVVTVNLNTDPCYDVTIHSLKGLEYLPELKTLKFVYNDGITEVDLSKNTKLVTLKCNYCNIAELDLTNNPDIEYLDCTGNPISSLDLSKQTKLKVMNALDMPSLKELDLSNKTELTNVSLYRGVLESLNLSGCSKLQEAAIYENQLKELNISGCSELSYLGCYDNQIPALDVSACTKLSFLDCYNNKLTSLSIYPNLRSLSCQNNLLTELDISNSQIDGLNCEYNKLEKINIAGCNELWFISFFMNQMSAEAVGELVEALPYTRTSVARLLAIDVEDENEGNVVTTQHVAIATEKRWHVYDKNEREYEGSEVPGASDEGDANGDGEVNVADIDFVIEAIGADIATHKAADLNGDGEINVADVDYIIERIK